MKSGAGDDPFADAEPETADEPSDRESTEEDETPEPTSATAERDRTDSRGEPDHGTRDDRMTVDDLPYIARRNVRGESVKTGRDKNVLFELRPKIADREDQFVEELERRIGTDVPKTDAREAALAAIWDRPDLVVPILEEWGLGYFED